MPILDSNVAHFFFEASEIPPEVFKVASFVGQEEISRLPRFEINLISEDPAIDFSSIVNKPASFWMMRDEGPVYFNGIVIHFEQLGRAKDEYAYQAILVPRLWWLTLNHQSRIFQEMTVQEIIQMVLEDAGVSDYRFELNVSYDPREYCVQHRESDFNFISRLMEFEGICYYFEHTEGGETLVMSDDRANFSPIEGESTIGFDEAEGLIHEDLETIQQLRCREKIVTGEVILKDYNYETPNIDLKVESKINGEMPGTYYDYGEHYKDKSHGDRLAVVRNEEIECQRRILDAWSDCMGMRPGYTFSLENHYRSDFNEDYIILAVQHAGSQRQALSGQRGASVLSRMEHTRQMVEFELTYSNTIQFRSASEVYRPARLTPVPQIPGVMIGKIQRKDAPYADLDETGRYHAHMDFDLDEPPPMSGSKPIRMNQPYSGSAYGIHFPNHDATEMIWACVNGDIDRPIALGTAPNPNNGSPSIADNQWQNVIKTWGKNELTFDDKQGEENIYMFATKDHTVVVTNNESIWVGHDQAITVKNDREKRVDHDQSESIGNDKTIEVEHNHTETIGNDKNLNVVKNHDEAIGANMTINVGENLSETVNIDYDETVGGSMTVTVGASLTTTVGGDSTQTVGSNKTVTIRDSLSQEISKDKSITVGKDLKEEIGGKHTEEVADAYSVSAKKIQLVAKDQIEFKVGKASMVMKKNGDITIQGKKIQIKGSGDVIVKGSKIKEN